METQQFNLRWNNHTSNILQVFMEHLTSEFLVDVTLSCQGRFIRAHKIVLSACSPYFQQVFADHTDKHPIIIFKGIAYEDLESMIKFMYKGEIRVREARLNDLLATAETLGVKGLSNVRSKYEKGEITPPNRTEKSLLEETDPLASFPLTEESQATKAAFALLNPAERLSDRASIAAVIPEHTSRASNLPNLVRPTKEPSSSNTVRVKEAPRVRKRRKMSHTVNELARETVFASNGTILLEPDEAVVRRFAKMKKMPSTTDRTKGCDNSDSSEPRKLESRTEEPSRRSWLENKPEENRPGMNAFAIFANERRRKLTIEYPKENETIISVRLGTMWNQLSIRERDTYYELAKRANDEGKRSDYFYSPREARSKEYFNRDHSMGRRKFHVNEDEQSIDYCIDATDQLRNEQDTIRYESDIEIIGYAEKVESTYRRGGCRDFAPPPPFATT